MKDVRGGGYTPVVCNTGGLCFSGEWMGTCTGDGKNCRCEGSGIPENYIGGCAH
ncbi:hypothetical protein IDJ75_20445 [Mucilaginibacter rigui]|uniref:Bacteriocin n=2 Tax=Mucilaginibacter rigui TaxID=534635 RepID=A0ABR7XAP6_9SPHI|nr:hypothetical protein [Mucilaginibacter rigui]